MDALLFRVEFRVIELVFVHDSMKDMVNESWLSVSHDDLANPPAQLSSFCCLLQYTSDVVNALKILVDSSADRVEATSDPDPVADNEVDDWVDDLALEDVESDGDESDEDLLCNKLCTYMITQKEFMNQHWYHCHTCRMVDGVGVCTVCAKVSSLELIGIFLSLSSSRLRHVIQLLSVSVAKLKSAGFIYSNSHSSNVPRSL